VKQVQECNGESSYRRYLDGEKDAFSDIINLYKKGLIGFIFRHVGNPDIAEDISEDCFVALIVHPNKYKFKSSLKTYLYGIAHNKVKEHFRRNKYVSFVPLEDANELCSSGSTEDEAVKTENRKMINQAFSYLAKDYCEVLYLHYFEDMSYEDIGKIMKKSPKQIYNLVFRAKNMLREKLEKDGFIYEEP
jgi:RNA polymerase sigma-70 factor (ECF subfamily)